MGRNRGVKVSNLPYTRIWQQTKERGPGAITEWVAFCAAHDVDGVEITRLGRRIYRDVLIEREDPRGHKYYWIGGEPPTGVIEEGTDFAALAANRISVTPLQLDLTAHRVLDELRDWQLGLDEGDGDGFVDGY